MPPPPPLPDWGPFGWSVQSPSPVPRSPPPPPGAPSLFLPPPSMCLPPHPPPPPVAGFAIGPGTLFGVILNEIFPEEVLPFGAPLVGMSCGLFALLTTALFPPLEMALGTGVFGIFGGITAVVWTYLLVCLPETKGCTRQQITRKVTQGSWLQGLYA